MADPVTLGNLYALSNLLVGTGQAKMQEAAGIYQQTNYILQARNTLETTQLRADLANDIAAVQAGRILKRAELESMNYQAAGNQLLKNMRATNASIRARAAARGVAIEGSVEDLQQQNISATMRDVAIADYNSVLAKVMGFEDASALVESTGLQGMIAVTSAKKQAGQYEQAGAAARRTGGILSDFQIAKSGLEFAKTFNLPQSTGKFGPTLDKFYGGTGTSGD